MTVRARLRRSEGIASLELAMILPLLLLLLSIVMPLVFAGWKYMVVSRSVAHGIRYATRVDPNPRISDTGTLTRRPSIAEVEAFVREAAAPLDLGSVSVSPEPSQTLPGDLITVRSTYSVTFGPVASFANAITKFFGGDTLLPESWDIAVSARGREE